MVNQRREGAGGVSSGGAWPVWAKGVVSAVLAFHGLAVVSAALAGSPSSALERQVARLFLGYNQVMDQGYSYRYYVNGPPPTPIVLATLNFADGTSREVRIPERSLGPRLRFQRHLALAYHLRMDVNGAPRDREGNSQSRWARSYARHLCEENPGCVGVELRLTDHLNPTPEELLEAAREGKLPLDVEASRYYTVPERVGEYPCRD